MQPQGQVTSIQLLDATHVNIIVTEPSASGAQGSGAPVATIRMLKTDAPPLGALVDITVRVTA